MAIVLGLAVAVVYGAADFLGGRTSRDNRPAAVVAVSQVTSLVLLGALLLLDASPFPDGAPLAFGAASGIVSLVGVQLLYRGLALGAMGVIAPVTAVGAAVVPFAYGLLTGERPSPLALLGVAVALVAIALVAAASPPAIGGQPAGGQPAGVGARELVLAGAAGTAFGLAFIFLAESGEGGGFWPLLAARGASVPVAVIIALATGRDLAIAPGSRAAVAAAGVLDVLAIALYLLASRRGLISLVAVLGSLYPATTVILARVVLHERFSRTQLVGLALALGGVLLIAS